TLTTNTQPAVLTASVAAAAACAERGLEPTLAAGHSLGEYSALVVARALRFADAVRIVRKRGAVMQDAVPVGTGAMAAIMGLDLTQVERVCAVAAEGEVVGVANVNARRRSVSAGRRAAVEVGPGRARTGLLRRIVDGVRGLSIEDRAGLGKALAVIEGRG